MKQQLLVLLVPVLILLASCQPQKEAIDKLGINKDEFFWGCLKPLQFWQNCLNGIAKECRACCVPMTFFGMHKGRGQWWKVFFSVAGWQAVVTPRSWDQPVLSKVPQTVSQEAWPNKVECAPPHQRNETHHRGRPFHLRHHHRYAVVLASPQEPWY